MKNKIILLIIVFILLVGTLSVSLSYIGLKVNQNGDFETKVKTGSLNIELSDNKLDDVSLIPVYDKNYDKSGYKKEFTITSYSDSLNACTSIYLKLNNYEDKLKDSSFKYKLISENLDLTGDFSSVNEDGYILLAKNIFTKSDTINNYTLYIWLSYKEDKDQTSLLNTNINANIYIKSFDSENSCGE